MGHALQNSDHPTESNLTSVNSIKNWAGSNNDLKALIETAENDCDTWEFSTSQTLDYIKSMIALKNLRVINQKFCSQFDKNSVTTTCDIDEGTSLSNDTESSFNPSSGSTGSIRNRVEVDTYEGSFNQMEDFDIVKS